jgi:hypothetical protein
MFRRPIVYFLPTALCLRLAARFGAFLRTRRPLQEDEQADFGVIQGATLTLFALMIGFSLSLATSRYDLRKNYEEAEANAIGTEWVRAGLLAAPSVSALSGQGLGQAHKINRVFSSSGARSDPFLRDPKTPRRLAWPTCDCRSSGCVETKIKVIFGAQLEPQSSDDVRKKVSIPEPISTRYHSS